MATVSTFNVALVASTGRFVAAISQAERKWNNFARQIQRQSKMMPKAIQSVTPAALTLARVVAKAGAVVGAALTGLGGLGVKLAADFEQTRIAFTTLLGDAKEADRFLRELDIFARKTPFGVEELRQAARQMLAYGFAADQVLGMITPIGDTVAAMGGNREVMERVIRALGQMQAKGRVMGEEMLQLTEAGINAWRYLAEELGTSIPDAMDRVTKRQVSAAVGINAILKGMAKDFGGAMEAQSKTILGQWEQIKDSITIMARGLGQDIVRIFGIAQAMERLNIALGKLADAVSRHGFVGALARAFPPWLPAVVIGISGAIGGALVPVIVSWLIPALKKLTVSLWATLRPLTPWMLIGAAVATTAYLITKYWGQLPALANASWGAVNAVVLYSASIIVRGTAAIISAIAIFVPGFRGAAQAVYGWADSLKAAAAQALSTAGAALRSAQGTKAAAESAQKTADAAQKAADAQDGLGKAMQDAAQKAADNIQSFDEVHQIQDEMSGTAGMVADALSMQDLVVPAMPDVSVAGAMKELADSAEQTFGKLAGVFERVQQALAPLSKHLETIAGVIALTLLPRFLSLGARMLEIITLSGRLGEALTLLRGSIVALGEALRLPRIAQWITETLKLNEALAILRSAFIRLAEGIRNSRIGQLAAEIWAGVSRVFASFRENKVIQYISEAISGIIARFEALKTAIAESAIGRFFTSLFEIASRLAGPFKLVWDWIVKIIGWVGKLWDVLTKIPFLGPLLKLAGRFAGIVGWILLIIDAARAAIWVFQNWEKIPDILAEKWGAFKEFMVGLWDGLKSWIGQKITEAWDGIKAFFAKWWDELLIVFAGPVGAIVGLVAKNWDAIKAGTMQVWNSISSWLSDTWERIRNSVSSTWDSLRSTITSSWETIRQKTSDIWDAIKTKTQEVWDGIVSWLSGTLGRIKDNVTNTWNTISGWLSSKFNEIKANVSTAWEAIKNTITTQWNNIRTTTENAWNALAGWLTNTLDRIKTTAGTKWAEIRTSISSLVDTTKTHIETAWNNIASGLDRTWQNIKSRAATLWDGVKDVVRGSINSIIEIVNRFIRAFNRIEISLPRVPDWVPGIGGKGGGKISFPHIPEIPYLARGGIVDRPTVAMVGEAGPEAVIPLPPGVRSLGDLAPDEDRLAQAIYQAVLTAMRVAQVQSPSHQGGDREIVLRLDGTAVARAILPAIIREGQRQGLQLVVRPQGV